LSACETGRGQKAKGEGLLGLPRMFLGAGAKQVVMTSWKIADQASSILMTQFYDNFMNKGMLRSEALQQAKRTLLSEKDEANNLYYQHPFFWASYSIYGKPEMPHKRKLSYLFIFSIVVTLIFFVFVTYYIFKSKRSKYNLNSLSLLKKK